MTWTMKRKRDEVEEGRSEKKGKEEEEEEEEGQRKYEKRKRDTHLLVISKEFCSLPFFYTAFSLLASSQQHAVMRTSILASEILYTCGKANSHTLTVSKKVI